MRTFPRRSKRLSAYLEYLVSLSQKAIPVIVIVIATFSYLITGYRDQQRLKVEAMIARDSTSEFVKRLQAQQAQLDNLNRQTNDLLSSLLHSSKIISGSPQASREIAALKQNVATINTDIDRLHSELDTLNSVLVTNPEKALTVPLLRKDLDDWKVSTQKDIDSIRGEMTRSYDLNRWLIGLILAAVIGTILSNFIQAKASKPDKAPRFE
jgi:hypothetical protein